jgi:DNA-binding MarR family transcriptional regulator
MDPPPSASSAGPALRTLLDLDRTLSPSDRKVLEVLLLRGSQLSARELSRGTGTNLQALYGALDRLERRGFVTRDRTGGSTRFRSAHPSVILHSLLEPGKRAVALAGEVEAPLRRIYEGVEGGASEPAERHAATTASLTAASSWLLDLVGGAVGEVWFLGDESPWFPPGASLEGEISSRGRLPKGVQVRMLVPPPSIGDARRSHLDRLEQAGVDVRYSRRFHAPAVIVDRRWLLLRSGTSGGAGRGTPVYLRLDSPDLCRDLLSAGQEAWSQSGATAPSTEPGEPGPPAAGRSPSTGPAARRSVAPSGTPTRPTRRRG